MGRGVKQKGVRWEREAAKELSKNSGKWRRVPGSGALGSVFGNGRLFSDLVGDYPWWSRQLRAEAKCGYGGSKQMTIRREWVTKNRAEAKLTRSWPCLLLKFSGVTGGDIASARLICFDLETWNEIMKEQEELWREYLKMLESDVKTR